jgi:hypothetical protein
MRWLRGGAAACVSSSSRRPVASLRWRSVSLAYADHLEPKLHKLVDIQMHYTSDKIKLQPPGRAVPGARFGRRRPWTCPARRRRRGIYRMARIEE